MENVNDLMLRNYIRTQMAIRDGLTKWYNKTKPETGAEFIQIVFFVAVFVVPVGIIFWLFQAQIKKFWHSNVECRFTAATCQDQTGDIVN